MDAGILGVEDRTSSPEPASAVSFGANTVCQQTKLTPWREIWTSLSLAEVLGNRDIIEAFLNSLLAEAAFGDEGALFRRGRHMQCQRCLINEVRYRATTDIMDIKICLFCAEEARGLGIAVEALAPDTSAFCPDEPSKEKERQISHVRKKRRSTVPRLRGGDRYGLMVNFTK